MQRRPGPGPGGAPRAGSGWPASTARTSSGVSGDMPTHPGTDDPVNQPPKWSDPGVEQVAPGVHRVPLPLPMDGLRAVNVYVLETDDGLVLIDGGWAIPESRAQFDLSLKEIGYTVADIRRFLVTHMHRDHYTQAVAVRREVGSHVVLGIGDKATLDLIHDDATNEDPTVARLTGRRRGGARRGLARDDAKAAIRRSTTSATRTSGWTARRRSRSARARSTRSRRPATRRVTSCSPTGRPACSSPATTCSRRSRRRSGSSRRTSTAAARLPRVPGQGAARCPTCCCSRRTGRCRRRRTHGSTSWSSSTTCAWRSRWPRSRGAPPTPGPSPASCRGRGGTAAPRDLDPFDAVLAAFETLAHLELLAARDSSAAPRTTGPSASVLSHPRHRRCLMGDLPTTNPHQH